MPDPSGHEWLPAKCGGAPVDLEQCRALWTQMVQHHGSIYDDPSIGGEDPGAEFDSHLDLVGPEKIWGVESGGELVGMTALVVRDQEAEIEPVIVSSDSRGKGIGRALLKHAVEEAKKLGVLCLGVKPVARNEGAIRFFHDCGFNTLGHIQMFMWLGESAPDAWKRGPGFLGLPFDY